MKKMLAVACVLVACAVPSWAAQLLTADAAVAAFTNTAKNIKLIDGGKTIFYAERDASNVVTRVAYLKVATGYKGKITLFAIAKAAGDKVVFDSIQIVEGKDKYKERTNGQEGNYMKQFAGKPADKETKEMKLELDSISGASVTARAIKRAIDAERPEVLKLFGLAK